jgi:hypothetical protein
VIGYATPEEAAREGTPVRFVRVVGTVVRGDRAIVAQRMNDRPMYEVDTAFCARAADGLWHEESSGNSIGGFLPTGSGRATVVAWQDDAPEWAVAARYACGRQEAVVPVVDECVFCVFDDVEVDEGDWFGESADLVAWIRADGSEAPSGRHRATPEQRAWMRAIHERMAEPGGLDADDPLLRGPGSEIILISEAVAEEEPERASPGDP